jgi:2-oxoglutarate ferredoxin oxidoreductase subunit beta
MATLEDYGKYETAWCPGCGNFGILLAVKKAMVAAGLEPHQLLFVSGIGQAAKAPHYLNANVFNGLHGRSLPVATAAKLANPSLKVVVESGDGCNYGEGGNHFLAAIRRNIDVTMIVHDNQVYGLTKGQASPTSDEGFVTKAQPDGTTSAPFNPVAVAVAMHAGFVARSYAAMTEHLSSMIQQGMAHRGFAIIDVFQPCVSFNHVNTYEWYKQRCGELPKDYDPANWEAAMKTAQQWGGTIPIGVIYRTERPAFADHFPFAKDGLVGRATDYAALAEIINSYE